MKQFVLISTFFVFIVTLPAWVSNSLDNENMYGVVLVLPAVISYAQLLFIHSCGVEYNKNLKLSHVHPLSLYYFLVIAGNLLCLGWYLHKGEIAIVIDILKHIIPFTGITLIMYFIETCGWLDKFIFWISEDL